MNSIWTITAMSKPPGMPAQPQAIPPRLVDEILEDQRFRWRRRERVLVEAYLQQTPALRADRNAILDLIYDEIVLREQAGEQPQQQEYARRFPLFSAELALLFEVDRSVDWQRAVDFLSDDECPPRAKRTDEFDWTALADQLGITREALREKLARAVDRAAHDLDDQEKKELIP
jgi:hypothetical protein